MQPSPYRLSADRYMTVCLFLGRTSTHAQRKLVCITASTTDLKCDLRKISLIFPIVFPLPSLVCPVLVEQSLLGAETICFQRNLSFACYELYVLGEYKLMTLNYC